MNLSNNSIYGDYSIPPAIIVEYKDDYGSLSVFISSLLLSLGGFIGIILSQLHKSRCSRISCCGFKCHRDVVSEDNVV